MPGYVALGREKKKENSENQKPISSSDNPHRRQCVPELKSEGDKKKKGKVEGRTLFHGICLCLTRQPLDKLVR